MTNIVGAAFGCFLLSASDPSRATLAIVMEDGSWKVYPTAPKEILHPIVAERVDASRWSDFTFVGECRDGQASMTAIDSLCKRHRREWESMFWTEDWDLDWNKRPGDRRKYYTHAIREACSICPRGTTEMQLALAIAIETRMSAYWDSNLPDRAGKRKEANAMHERRRNTVNRL